MNADVFRHIRRPPFLTEKGPGNWGVLALHRNVFAGQTEPAPQDDPTVQRCHTVARSSTPKRAVFKLILRPRKPAPPPTGIRALQQSSVRREGSCRHAGRLKRQNPARKTD